MKMYSRELFSLVFLREKFENTLEVSGKTQGKLRENSGNLVSQKCGRPDLESWSEDFSADSAFWGLSNM